MYIKDSHGSVSSAESQKGINAAQCFTENQKGAIAIDLYSDGAILVLNGTLLNSINALLVLTGDIFLFTTTFQCEYSGIFWNIFEYFGIFQNTPGYYGIFQIIVIPLYSRVFQNIPECYKIF